MEKSLFKRMGGTYHQEGDYFLSDLSVPELPAIGIWGQRRRRYLKEHLYSGGKWDSKNDSIAAPKEGWQQR